MVTEVYYIIQHTPTRLILYGYSDSVTEVCIFNFVLDIVIARPVSSGEQTRVVAMYSMAQEIDCQRAHLRCPLVIMCDYQREINSVCVSGPRRAPPSVGYTRMARILGSSYSLHF